MRIEPAIHAYLTCRRKRHGAGAGSRLRAIKMALCAYAIANGGLSWHARLAAWMAFHGTPKLPNLKPD